MNTDAKTQNKSQAQLRYLESLRRWTLALLGILCVGLAALGAILPGLPTTIFLIAAAFLFTKSCPRLEQILIRNRFFAAFHHYLDGTAKIPWRTKLMTLAIMWFFIATSCVVLFASTGLSLWIVSMIPLAGVVGTWFIANRGN